MSGRRALLAVAVAAALAFVLGGTAHAAMPTATTGPATAIGSSIATVTGTVVPGGQATTWYVQYGTSTAYGSQTAKGNAGSGTVAVNITSTLADLKAGATYHYRVVATNGAGTAHGSDAVFTTLVPPGATTGAATAVGTTSATLNGTVDPNSRDTTFYFEYGTTTGYGSQSPEASAGSGSGATAVASAISGLQPGTVYHYRLVAANSQGTTQGADQTFTTMAPVPVQAAPVATAPVDATPPATTAKAACKTSLRVSRKRRMAIVTLRCAPAGRVTAVVMQGRHRLVRVHRTLRAAGGKTIHLRIARKAFARHRSLRLTVKVTVAGARKPLQRRITIRR